MRLNRTRTPIGGKLNFRWAALARILPFALAFAFALQAHSGELGVRDGVYSYRGQLGYRAFGVNYFDAINRGLNDPSDTTVELGIQHLADYRIPFIRVMFGGFWPNELKIYQTDKARYFRAIDKLVATCERFGIGIVASLGWNYASFADLVGEPHKAWGQPNSKTTRFFTEYVKEIVSRYKQSPSIWMWEFGNEMSLYVDLPNIGMWRRPTNPEKGTPQVRSAADDLTSIDQHFALSSFVQTVRAIDPETPLSTGNSLPRPYAYHNRYHGTWKSDTDEEFCKILREDNPDGFDVISVHIYASTKGNFGAREGDYSTIISHLAACAKDLRKPIMVGEFGASETEGGTPDGTRTKFISLIDTLQMSNIGLAALWVYDFPYQSGTHSVTPGNNRSYQLDLIRQANQVLRKSK